MRLFWKSNSLSQPIVSNSGDMGERIRSFSGFLPEGSKVKRLKQDTLTTVEHGERTWTTAQTVRDILQNHLDAQTQLYFDELVVQIFDVARPTAEERENAAKNLDAFMY